MDDYCVFVFDWESKSRKTPLISREKFKPNEGKYKSDGESEKFALIGEHINGVLKVTRYKELPRFFLNTLSESE